MTARELMKAYNTAIKATKKIMAYCTEDCTNCPILKNCEFLGLRDFDGSYANDVTPWEAYVRKAERHDEKEEAKAFKDATGYEPMEWDMLSRRGRE